LHHVAFNNAGEEQPKIQSDLTRTNNMEIGHIRPRLTLSEGLDFKDFLPEDKRKKLEEILNYQNENFANLWHRLKEEVKSMGNKFSTIQQAKDRADNNKNIEKDRPKNEDSHLYRQEVI
jgi:hypothetical protein